MKMFTAIKRWWKYNTSYCNEGGNNHEYICIEGNGVVGKFECQRCQKVFTQSIGAY